MTDEQIHNLFEAMGKRISVLSQRIEYLEALKPQAPKPELPPVTSLTDDMLGDYVPEQNARLESELVE